MVSTHKIIEIPTDKRHKEEMTIEETSKTTRSYDCTFCKRGFTNAQALGGHMNIHRKDKAKAKKPCETSVSRKAYEYFAPISSDQAQFYAILKANKNYQMFSSQPNTNFSQRVSNREFLTPYEDLMGSNLNLKIGLPISEERREKIKSEEHQDMNWLGNEQVDLELRLGRNPYK